MKQNKIQLDPNTTLYPVPVVLISCGEGDNENLFTLNRIVSCNAEPPMIAISVRPQRASHQLIAESGEFVVNLPYPDMEILTDYVGSTTVREIDKWVETGLRRAKARIVAPPLIDQCPVNLECQVRETITLPSHTMFIAEVVAMHADANILNKRQEVDMELAGRGLPYRSSVVRERPVEKFRPETLLEAIRERRRQQESNNALPLVTLYTKAGCHLCEEVKGMLAQLGEAYPHQLEEIDITTDEQLFSLFKHHIPVVNVGDDAVQAPITEDDLRGLLKGCGCC